MISLPVRLPGPVFLLGGLCPWSNVPSRGVCLLGGLHSMGGSVCRGLGRPSASTRKGRWLASYWNSFLLKHINVHSTSMRTYSEMGSTKMFVGEQ